MGYWFKVSIAFQIDVKAPRVVDVAGLFETIALKNGNQVDVPTLPWRIAEDDPRCQCWINRTLRYMVIGFRQGEQRPCVIKRYRSWAVASDKADALIERDVCQVAYVKEY